MHKMHIIRTGVQHISNVILSRFGLRAISTQTGFNRLSLSSVLHHIT